MIPSRSLKTTRCSSFMWLFLVKSLAFAVRYIFLSPFGVSSSSYNSFIARALVVLLLSLPPCFSACSYLYLPAFLVVLTYPLPYHLLPLIIPPPCLLISRGSPPSCNSFNIVVLLSSHHSCILSTGLTFSNTISRHFIIRFSSINLHHFILGVASSGVQRFLPSLLLLMCQFRYPPTITLSPSCVALSSWCSQKRFFSILYTTHLWIISNILLMTGSLFSPAPTCSLPNHFALFPSSSLLHTQHSNLSRFDNIWKDPFSSRHRPNIQTANNHAVTVQMPHKKRRHLWRLNIRLIKRKIEK